MKSLLAKIISVLLSVTVLAIVYLAYSLAIRLIFFDSGESIQTFVLYCYLGSITAFATNFCAAKLSKQNRRKLKSLGSFTASQLAILVITMPLFGFKTYVICAITGAIYGVFKRLRKRALSKVKLRALEEVLKEAKEEAESQSKKQK